MILGQIINDVLQDDVILRGVGKDHRYIRGVLLILQDLVHNLVHPTYTFSTHLKQQSHQAAVSSKVCDTNLSPKLHEHCSENTSCPLDADRQSATETR